MAAVPGGLLTCDINDSDTGDLALSCEVVPNEVNPVTPPYCDFELRLAVDKPKIMFRPHIDWYTVEHGPNYPDMANGHNSATRMLCIQTADDVTALDGAGHRQHDLGLHQGQRDERCLPHPAGPA